MVSADRWLGVVSLCGLLACGGGTASHSDSAPTSEFVAEIILPSTTMTPGEGAPGDSLAFSPSMPDELPIGPTSLAIAPDGNIVVPDPLRESIVRFAGDGRVVSRVRLGFAVDRIAEARGSVWVRRARDGAIFELLSDGALRESAGASPFSQDSTVLSSDGTVRFTGPDGAIKLSVPSGRGRIMSARWLHTDRDASRWIAYEFVGDDSLVDVTTIIAKHASDGRRIGEAAFDHPDVELPPTDEFAVSAGMIYQLLPSRSGTRIRVKRVGAGA